MLADIPILSLITFAPLLGVLILFILPREKARALRIVGIAATIPPLGLALWLFAGYHPAEGGGDFAEDRVWASVPLNHETLQDVIGSRLVLHYHLAIDGLSLPLVLLTAFVTLMAALASVYINKRWKTFYIWFLILETGTLGVFLARDLVLFFLFFEITLVAMFFLVGIWGYFAREKAANRFLLYNGIGSALMLIAFVILVVTAGFSVMQESGGAMFRFTSDYDVILANLGNASAYANIAPEALQSVNPFYLSDTLRWSSFILLLIAFGIKLPFFPFHTWMLRVHTEAPPSVVMIHSGILLKMGAYGLLRFGVLLFPQEAHSWSFILGLLGVINLLYGAVLAIVQTEFKLVLAYSSISHMGIVLLGIASFNETGLQGAVFQLVSHGLVSALLFLIVGVLYERTGTTELAALGGLARSMPFVSGVLLTAGLASLGLPGLSGFVGEFLAFLGLFETMKWLTAIAALGVILTAVYVLRAILNITFGPIPEAYAALRDARLIEAVPMIALLAFIVLLGVYPSILTDSLQNSFDALLAQLMSRVGG